MPYSKYLLYGIFFVVADSPKYDKIITIQIIPLTLQHAWKIVHLSPNYKFVDKWKLPPSI